MKCNNCGFENEWDLAYCPNCGAALQNEALVSPNIAATTVLAALKDNLFLVICILTSVSCLLSLTLGSLPILNVLAAVFLWLTYAQSRKDLVDTKHLRCVSGTVYAGYVITYVVAGLFLVLGVLFAVAFGALAGQQEVMNSLLNGMIEMDDMTASFFTAFVSVGGGVILVIFALIAIVATILNVFSMRYIHRFVKSVYQSVEAGELNLRYPNAAQIWLFIFGGVTGLSALTSLVGAGITAFLGNAVTCAIYILAGLLIRKHFDSEEQ